MLNETLIESSTQILYSIKHLSGDLKVYWSRYLSFSFSALTHSQVQQREITAASKAFADREDAILYFKELTQADQVWILASLKLLMERAFTKEDWIGHRDISLLVEQLNQPELASQEEEMLNQIQAKFSEFEKRKVLVVNGSIAAISFDYFLRWTVLVFGNIYALDYDAILGFNSLIFLPAVAFAYWNFRKDKKKNEKLISSNGFSDLFKVKFRYSTLQYTIICFYLITGAVISFLIKEDVGSGGVFGIVIALALIYSLLLVIFPMGRLTEHDLLQQTRSVEKKFMMDSDGNDEVIVSIETQLNSSTGRLEAYVLESALFGALAFSGFLQIISTDLVSFSDLEKFASVFHHVAQSLVLAKWNELYQFSAQLDNKINLFCLVSIETLVCSALFLAVIASRLRFSDVADRVRTALNLAKVYNEKEEALLESASQDEKSVQRLNSLNKKIEEHLVEAQNDLNRVEPIVSYMVYFRNAGLLAFLAVLVTSSLFITSFLGWGFIAIGVATWIYFNMKTIRSGLISFGLNFRIFYARHSWLLFALAVSPALLGFLLSAGLHLPNTRFLIALSFLLTGCYFFVWLVLMPHHDSRFGDIENLKEETWRSSSWRTVKNIYGLVILISFIGFAFKVLGFQGANELLIIGLTSMSLIFYAVGYYLTRPRWLGFLSALMLGTAGIGVLFRVQNWAGANEMLILAIFPILLFFALFAILRKSFHYILFRVTLLFAIVAFSMSPKIIFPSLWGRTVFMYDHRTLFIKKIMEAALDISSIYPNYVNIKAADKSLEASDNYIKAYGTEFGKTGIYKMSVAIYGNVAGGIMLDYTTKRNKTDSLSLDVAFRSAHQRNKINSLFGDCDIDVVLEAQALRALGRHNEANIFLQDVLKKERDETIQRAVKKELENSSKKTQTLPQN